MEWLGSNYSMEKHDLGWYFQVFKASPSKYDQCGGWIGNQQRHTHGPFESEGKASKALNDLLLSKLLPKAEVHGFPHEH